MNRDATRINTVGLLAGGSSVDTEVAADPYAGQIQVAMVSGAA